MPNKLNLEVGRGNGYDSANKYSLKFALKNHDTTTIALSALRVTSYGWFPQRNILTQFTSGVNFPGNLLQVVSAVDPYYGVGQTGIVPLNMSTTTYRVNHTVVDSSKISPQLTINVPSGGSSIGTVSFINSTDTYFDIVIDDPPPTAGYTVTWFLPGVIEVYTGSPVAISNPNISIEKLQTPYIRVKNRKADTKIVFSWNGSTTLIPQNWGVSGIDAYVEVPNLYPSNNILSAWYSKPEVNVLDNPYFVLEQFNGVSWEVVFEYDTAYSLDAQTGVVPSDNLFLKIQTSATGKSVYITPSSGNPIAGSVFDRNNLSLYSKGSSGDKRRRSLLKIETSAIPSSATSIKNAVLRLNVNSLSNAWNYSSTNGHIGVYRVTSDWTENEATWTNRKTGTPWTVSGGDYLDSPAIWLGNSNLSNSFTSADQNNQFWVDFDVTTIVEYWRNNPTLNYGFLIKLYDSTNENSLSDIKWELNSSRLSGTGAIAGYPELLISYNTLNVNGPTPTLTISEPNDNQSILTPTVNFSVNSSIAGGTVETVGLYYREKNSINPYTFLANLSTNDYVNWVGNVPSLSVGEYDFVARGISDLGNIGESLPVRINFVSVPQVTFNVNGICYESSVDITGTISTPPTSGYIQYKFQDIPSDKKITKIIEDKIYQNVLWISTEGNGLFRLDKTTNDIRRFNTSNSSLVSNYIVDISIETNGLLWMSLRNELDQRGMGLVSFNTVNYLNPSSSDFSFYDTTNSPLSSYSHTMIDINSVHVDSSDNKWIGLTLQSINSVIKFEGYVFDDTHSTIYNINLRPRKITSFGSTIFVSNSDSQVSVYDGSWNVYSFSNNVNSMYPENSSKLWVGLDGGLALLDSGVISEVVSENTPAFPNGLSSATFHNVNKRVTDIFVDSFGVKWISFSTGANDQYNGGFAKYSGTNLLSGSYTNPSNWDCKDKSNFSGILNNSLYQTLLTTDLGICVVGVSGLSIFDNNGWKNCSNTYGKKYPLSVSGNSYTSNILQPKYGNVEFEVVLDYGNSEYLVSSFSAQIEKGLSVSTVYPSNGFGAISGGTNGLVYKTSFDNLDISNGDNITSKLYMSTNENSGWQLIETKENEASPEFKLTIPKEQFFYFKTIVENQNCVTESNVGLVYGMSDLGISANSVSGTTNTKDTIKFTGLVYDKDFTRTLSVNGNSFSDSISNIKVEYVSGANVTIVGYANTVSQGNGYVDFSFDWTSPVANVSALRFTATTVFGNAKSTTTTFSSVKNVPTISILSPIQNQIISRNSSIVLSATASYVSSPVSALAFYAINDTSAIYFGSATSGAGGWTKTITPSALNLNGSYSLYASAVDNVGTSSVSNPIDFSVNYPPVLTPISDLSATHDGTYQFVASIYDQNTYYGNKIEILSGGSVYYIGYANGFGEFVWNWVSPPNGSTVLSAKLYDGNPALSSDYSVTQLSFNLNLLTVTLSDPGFPSAKYNNVTLTPRVNVVRANEDFSISASVTGVFDHVNYWLCEEDEFGIFRKKSILSTGTNSTALSLPTSRYYDELYVSKYKFYGIIAEVVSINGSSIDSNIVKFYSKEQTLEIGLATSVCSDPITFSGKVLDSDLPYYTVSNIIDNSVSAYIWDSSNVSAIGSFWIYDKNDEYRNLVYDWASPTSSTSAVEVRVVDSYSISASQKIVFGQIETNPTLTLSAIDSSKYISAVGTAYLVSAGSISVSSNASSPYISAFNYKLTYQDNSTKLVSSTNSNPHVSNITISGTENVVLMNGEYTTSGKCIVYSNSFFAFVVLTSATGNLVVDNCSNCYCSSGSLNVTATITDTNFNNNLLINLFGYSSSAVIYDDFNNIVYEKELTESSNTFNFTWNNPAENSTYLKLRIVNNHGIYADYTKFLTRQIFKSPTFSTIAPVDFSASNYIYKQNQDVVVQTDNSSDITQLKYYVDGLLVGIINNPASIQDFVWSKDKFPGKYVIEIMALNGTGCYSKVAKTIYASNGPIVSIISPSANSWINSGDQINLVVDVKDSGSSVSAVKLYNSLGTSAEAYYNPTNRMWYGNLSSASSVPTIALSAIAYDVSGNSTLKVNVINVATPPLISASVSGTTSATIPFNSVVTIDLSGASTNGASVVGYYINGTFVSATSSQANVSLPVAAYFTSGLNEVVVVGLDYYGSISNESIFLDVAPFTDDLSYPIIRYLNSTPESKIDFNKITTYFEITDYTNKIVPFTIGLGENSRGKIITSGIQVVDGEKKYIVPVEVEQSGSVIISAMNYVGQTAIFEEQNYIIRCKNGKLINITNFLPQYLRDDSSGNESEFFKFTKFFEDYLNSMYKNFDETCNLSILEKINKLQSLHDIDTIDPIYVQNYANMLGYGVDINNDELGTFTTNSSTVYADTNDEYKNKILRFVIGNLPNWYAIKTTRNAVKMMLLSFGIIGDIIEYYTLDYDKSWKANRTVGDEYVSKEMTKEWYPTPHISLGIDLMNSDNSIVYNSEQIKNVVNAMEDIRPANVVINGIQGYVSETPVQTVYLNISFRSTKNINITRSQQINSN